MKCGRDVLAKAYTSSAVGFLKEKHSEEKGRFTTALPSLPLSTGEKRRENKTLLEMHADHTNISKYLDGNVLKVFHILFPCCGKKVFFILCTALDKSRYLCSQKSTFTHSMLRTVLMLGWYYTGYLINLRDAWICCGNLFCTHKHWLIWVFYCWDFYF